MDNEKGKSGIVKWIIIAVVVIAALVAGILVFLNSQKLSATTMRLLKIEGIVKLFDKEKEKTITDNLRLSSGNAITTDTDSLASIALDETKIVTINDNSRAQFEQSGKKLNINLTAGSLFFNVTQKLAADESFDIRTSNMVVGIRGTSCLVCVDENGHEVLYITDGEVDVVGTNNVTKEQKTVTVKAGQKITIYLYNDKKTDSIMFELESVSDANLIDAIRNRLIEDEKLLDKVCQATGWDKDVILGKVSGESGTDAGSADTTETAASEQTSTDSGTEGASTQETTTGDTGAESTGAGSTQETTETTDTGEDAGAGEGGTSENTSAKAPTLIESMVKGYDADGDMILNNNHEFNPEFYLNNNSDVAQNIGNDPQALLEHYLTYGIKEGRAGTSQEAAATEQKKPTEQQQQEEWENWQETLDRLAQEEQEQQYLEEQQRLAEQAAEYQANNSGSGDESSSNSGEPGRENEPNGGTAGNDPDNPDGP